MWSGKYNKNKILNGYGSSMWNPVVVTESFLYASNGIDYSEILLMYNNSNMKLLKVIHKGSKPCTFILGHMTYSLDNEEVDVSDYKIKMITVDGITEPEVQYGLIFP